MNCCLARLIGNLELADREMGKNEEETSKNKTSFEDGKRTRTFALQRHGTPLIL